MSTAQVTSSARARTSARSWRRSGSSLATPRDSSLVASASRTRQWWWVLPLSTPAHIWLIVLQKIVVAVRTTDDLAGIALHSDLFALPNQRPGRRGVPGGEACSAMIGSRLKATPSAPGRPNPTNGSIHPSKNVRLPDSHSRTHVRFMEVAVRHAGRGSGGPRADFTRPVTHVNMSVQRTPSPGGPGPHPPLRAPTHPRSRRASGRRRPWCCTDGTPHASAPPGRRL